MDFVGKEFLNQSIILAFQSYTLSGTYHTSRPILIPKGYN